MIRVLLLAVLLLFSAAVSQPVLFPHGWFESKNLRPRDAIMLNMMAQSNLEYGGITLEELDKLDAVRKQLPRPESLPRDREEDNEELDRKPVFTEEGVKIEDEKKDEKVVGDADKKKEPFKRVHLNLQKKRETGEVVEQESDNPFEEISTRAPPRDWMSMRQLRNRNRKNKKKRRRYRKNGFLTRDDIIKSQLNSEAPSVKLTNREMEKAEFDETRRNKAEERWEREKAATEKVHEEMKEGNKERPEQPISPALEMLAKENADLDRRIAIAEQTGTRKVDRLPNNPYNALDLRKPTVLTLPLPPQDTLNEE